MHLPSYQCVCCNLGLEETLSHLSITCPFAQACWIRINIVVVESDPFLALEEIKAQLNFPFLMDVIILFCWMTLFSRGIPLLQLVVYSTLKKRLGQNG